MKKRYLRIHMYGDVLVPADADGLTTANGILDGLGIGQRWERDNRTGDFITYKSDISAKVSVEEHDPDMFFENEEAAEDFSKIQREETED